MPRHFAGPASPRRAYRPDRHRRSAGTLRVGRLSRPLFISAAAVRGVTSWAMLGKVRTPLTHPANGSDPQPKTGLSEGRLALVHRYMIDAEEAEARKLA